MEKILQLKGISKVFSNTTVLSNIDFDLHEGEIHALVGENGAGKSTMIKILSGVYQPDGGEIYLHGKRVLFSNPNSAQRAGISTLFQEIQEIPELPVVENIFMGREPTKGVFVDWKKLRNEAMDLINGLNLNIDPLKKMRELSISSRKMVEIARAVSYNASVVIMDEPTANLNEDEMAVLFDMIAELKKQKVSIIYISHRLNEVFRLADRITVLRDGQLIKTMDGKECNEDKLITLMTGRKIDDLYPARKSKIGDTVFSVDNLQCRSLFKNVSFELKKGEILGIAGLDASGANDLTKAIFGLYGKVSGAISCNSKSYVVESPKKSIEQGVAYLPEDRKTQGLFLDHNLILNTTIGALEKKFKKKGLINIRREASETRNIVNTLKVKTHSLHTKLKDLSGGNQQKVLLGRWMMDKYDVLILEEPTRGVDVGAKVEIYQQINKLAEEGLAILMYSSELPELMGLCDRIIVFSEGRVTACISKEDATQEYIMRYAIAGK